MRSSSYIVSSLAASVATGANNPQSGGHRTGVRGQVQPRSTGTRARLEALWLDQPGPRSKPSSLRSAFSQSEASELPPLCPSQNGTVVSALAKGVLVDEDTAPPAVYLPDNPYKGVPYDIGGAWPRARVRFTAVSLQDLNELLTGCFPELDPRPLAPGHGSPIPCFSAICTLA